MTAVGLHAATPDDVEVLRGLPALALREGYLDAYQTFGVLHLRRDPLRRELAALPEPLRALVRLLALGEPILRADLAPALGADDIAALERLGVLLEDDRGVHTGGLVLLPVLGQLAFVPSSAGNPYAFFGDDTMALLARLAPQRGARCLNLCAGAGLFALRAALLADHVVAVESNGVALGCIELNVVMNGLDDRIEVRGDSRFATPLAAPLAAIDPAERFDYAVAAAPLMPLPVQLFAPEGEAAEPASVHSILEQLLHGLPAVLAPGGRAQLVGADVGDGSGPAIQAALQEQATRLDLSIVLTVPCSAPLLPGTALFQAVAWAGAQTMGLPPDEARQRMTKYLRDTGLDRLYLFAITLFTQVQRPGLRVCRYDRLGQGFWFR